MPVWSGAPGPRHQDNTENVRGGHWEASSKCKRGNMSTFVHIRECLFSANLLTGGPSNYYLYWYCAPLCCRETGRRCHFEQTSSPTRRPDRHHMRHSQWRRCCWFSGLARRERHNWLSVEAAAAAGATAQDLDVRHQWAPPFLLRPLSLPVRRLPCAPCVGWRVGGCRRAVVDASVPCLLFPFFLLITSAWYRAAGGCAKCKPTLCSFRDCCAWQCFCSNQAPGLYSAKKKDTRRGLLCFLVSFRLVISHHRSKLQ